MEETMQPGDVVRLKSGGPKMTIRWINDGEAYCDWFEGSDHKNGKFAVVGLEKQ
jgi:uncharacterized protein YodC (DUF2158 family)